MLITLHTYKVNRKKANRGVFKLLRLKSNRLLRSYRKKPPTRVQRCSRCHRVGHNALSKLCAAGLNQLVDHGDDDAHGDEAHGGEVHGVGAHGEGGHGFAAQDEGAHGEAVQGASAGSAFATEAVHAEDIGGGELVEAAVDEPLQDSTLIMEDIEDLLNNSDELY